MGGCSFFKSLPGVSDVNSFGGYIKQYLIKVQPEQLLRYNLTLHDIVEAIQNNNLNAGGNIIERGEQQFIVRGVGLFRNLDDINETVLKTDHGAQVTLRDVALVEEGQAIRQGGVKKR